MSKIIYAILFAIILMPFCAQGQTGVANNSNIQTEVKTNEVPQKITELKSKLVDQYGVDGFRFVKSNDATTKTQKTLTAHELSETSGLDEYTIIIILAVIGAIAVILLVFR
ncbi:MAG: hypothetical protein JST55_01385 [Bacteroidetes bacterium]|nr:hypothetical protein [Bacteroidota bacterium]